MVGVTVAESPDASNVPAPQTTGDASLPDAECATTAVAPRDPTLSTGSITRSEPIRPSWSAPDTTPSVVGNVNPVGWYARDTTARTSDSPTHSVGAGGASVYPECTERCVSLPYALTR